MVNEKRIKNKLPELLSDGPLTHRKNYNKYQLTRYKINRMEKKRPFFLTQHIRKIKMILEEIEKKMESTEFEF